MKVHINPYTGARATCARFIVPLTLHIFDFLHLRYVRVFFCTFDPTCAILFGTFNPKIFRFFMMSLTQNTSLSACVIHPPPSPYGANIRHALGASDKIRRELNPPRLRYIVHYITYTMD